MERRYRSIFDDEIKPFYVVSFASDSFPELIGYSTNPYLAKAYAAQWSRGEPYIHTVYGTSIEDACKDDSEVSSLIKYYSTLSTEENEIKSITLIDNRLKRALGAELGSEEFMYTDRQISEITESGIDVMTETALFLATSVINLSRISKYVRDPLFKQVIDFMLSKYITIIAVLEMTYGDDTDINYMELSKLSNKIPYSYDDDFIFEISNFIDLFYLDYIAIKNNAL